MEAMTSAQYRKCLSAQDKLARLCIPSAACSQRCAILVEHSAPRRDAIMVTAQIPGTPAVLQPRLVVK